MNKLWSGAVSVGLLCLILVPSLPAAAPDASPEKPELGQAMRTSLELTARIDKLVEAYWASKGVQPAPLADDAEFLRRLSLDITGRIPHVSDVRAFLADPTPDKRARKIEELLGQRSNTYVNHFTTVWRTLMVPQTNNQQFNQLGLGLDAWLQKRLRDNTGFDRMVRELLTAPVGFNVQGGRPQGVNPAEPTAVAFYQANEFKPENLAAATSRLFLGVKLECAQCHDHPFAKWKRDQFWEYAAFFSGIQPQRGGFAAQADKPAVREITVAGTERKVQARFLDGKDPQWKDGTSSRATLAEWLTSSDNPFFARAAVNRLWAHFLGVGLIDPVDEMVGTENAVIHEELLDELARAFAAQQFDTRYLIRAITASKAYQLTSTLTDPGQADPRLLARMNLKGLTPEQLFDSLVMATGHRDQNAANQRFGGFGVNTPRGEFLAKFANHSDKRTEYSTSILQALMLMNGRFTADATDLVRGETLSGILDAPFLGTPQKIETLYLATLSRKPRSEEMERLVKYVEKDNPSSDAKKALADVLWVLLNSSEFILNH